MRHNYRKERERKRTLIKKEENKKTDEREQTDGKRQRKEINLEMKKIKMQIWKGEKGTLLKKENNRDEREQDERRR